TSFYSFIFFFYYSYHHRDLHSFPTRRSSDLNSVIIGSVACAIALFKAVLFALISVPVKADFLSTIAALLLVYGLIALIWGARKRSEEHTSELQSLRHLVCRLLLEKKKTKKYN